MVPKKLTKEEILAIPALILQGLKIDEIAAMYGVSGRTIDYQISKLRKVGIEVKTTRGPRPVLQ